MIDKPTRDMTDAELLDAFEHCRIPVDQWDHAAHLRVAYNYLRAESPPRAYTRMRQGILASNAAVLARGETLNGGYHETITALWLRLVQAAVDADPAPHTDSREFLKRHPELLDKRRLLDHYSKELLDTEEARTVFVAPDHAPLPGANPVPPDAESVRHARPTGISTEIMRSLLEEIERKDHATAAHTWRVALYARAMAESLGLTHDIVERVTRAGALHDVGKLDIPDHILQKPGKLTDEEFAIIKTHPLRGYERLLALGENDEIALRLVRHHHERWDGLGYPDALAGPDIFLGPRIFAVIDTFDALTSIRPYRREVGSDAAERALTILEEGAATRYWPEAVDLFTQLYRSGAICWILDYFNDEADLPRFTATESCHRLAKHAERRNGA